MQALVYWAIEQLPDQIMPATEKYKLIYLSASVRVLAGPTTCPQIHLSTSVRVRVRVRVLDDWVGLAPARPTFDLSECSGACVLTYLRAWCVCQPGRLGLAPARPTPRAPCAPLLRV